MRPLWDASGRGCWITTCNLLRDAGSAGVFRLGFGYLPLERLKEALLALSTAIDAVKGWRPRQVGPPCRTAANSSELPETGSALKGSCRRSSPPHAEAPACRLR